MMLWVICGYVILAAIFYLGLTATALDVSLTSAAPHKWLRARRIKNLSLLHRLRSRRIH